MQISGKFISGEGLGTPDFKATIELPTVNLQDIREGDEVWVKAIVRKGIMSGVLQIETGKVNQVYDVIAHFPQAKPEHSTQDKDGNPIWGSKEGGCNSCGQKWSNHDPEKCKPLCECCGKPIDKILEDREKRCCLKG